MQKIIANVKNTFGRIKGKYPQTLPTSQEGLEQFTSEILDLYGLPNNRNYHHTVAAMIMHIDALTPTASKFHFAKAIKKQMANEVAYAKIQQIKHEEAVERQNAQNEEKTKANAEAGPQEPSI